MRLSRLLSGTAAAFLAISLTVVCGQSAYAENCAVGGELTTVPWAQKMIPPEKVAPFATGRDVIVATLDTGVQGDIPQLRGHVLPGKDFLTPGGKGRGDRDCKGHGTGVASIIAGQGSTDNPFRGLAPGVMILPVKVTEIDAATEKGGADDNDNAVTPEGFAAALNWAVNEGHADIVNMSLAYEKNYPVIEQAVAAAIAKGVVLVGSGGNKDGEKPDARSYPVGYDGVIGVSAITEQGVLSGVSESGDWIDIAAPGDNVTYAARDGKYAASTGTSLSAPFVAATAALIIDAHEELRGKGPEITRRILGTASPAPGGMNSKLYGAGIVDPYRAVTDEMVPGTTPASMDPMTVNPVDPVAQANAETHATMTARAVWIGTGVAVTVILVLAVVGALRRGRRRGWHTTRQPVRDESDEPGDDGPIPLLYKLKL